MTGTSVQSAILSAILSALKSLKGVKLVHLNVRSLLAHFDEVRSDFLDGSIDIAVFSETWLHTLVADSLISVEGYNLFRLDRQTNGLNGKNKNGGGLCVYVKDTLVATAVTEHSISNRDLESIHVKVNGFKQKTIDLFVIYRPPSGTAQNAIESLHDMMSNVVRCGETVLVGDFNLDTSKPNDVKVKKLHSMTNSFSLVSHIKDPTRITHKTSTTIDLMYSDICHVSVSGTLNVNISDHLPIFVVKKKAKTDKRWTEILGRTYKKLDWDIFADEIRQIDLTDTMVGDNPNDIWDTIYTAILTILDRLCPPHLIIIRVHSHPYITQELADQIRVRDKAFNKARKTKLEQDWRDAKALRVTTRKALILARQRYITKQLDMADGDSRKFWSTINQNFLKSKTAEINSVYKQGTHTEVFGAEAANEINEFFCGISRNLSSRLARPTTTSPIDTVTTAMPDNLPPITVEEVLTQINSIDTSKSSGFRDINSRVLKSALIAIPDVFTRLLNRCVESGVFPESLLSW